MRESFYENNVQFDNEKELGVAYSSCSSSEQS